MICASALGACGLAVWADDCIHNDSRTSAKPVTPAVAATSEKIAAPTFSTATPEPADPEPQTKVLDLVSAPPATPVNPPVAPPVVPPEPPKVLLAGNTPSLQQLPDDPPPPPHARKSVASETPMAPPPPPLPSEPPPFPKFVPGDVPALAGAPPVARPIDLSPNPAPIVPPISRPQPMPAGPPAAPSLVTGQFEPRSNLAPPTSPPAEPIPVPLPPAPVPSIRPPSSGPLPPEPIPQIPEVVPPMPPPTVLNPNTAATAATGSVHYKLHVHMGGSTGPHFEVYDGETPLLRVHCDQIEMRQENATAAAGLVGHGHVRVSGSGVSGTCDELSVTSAQGDVQLKGNVHLHCYRGSASSQIDSDSMSFQLKGSADVPHKTRSGSSGKVVPASGSQP